MIDFDKIKVGETVATLSVHMDREIYFRYNKLVNNFNPLHSDADYAKKLGFDDIVVAGVYTFSFLTKVVEDWIGDSGRISGMELIFNKPVYIDTTINHSVRVLEKISGKSGKSLACEVIAENKGGEVLTRATVTLSLK